MLIAKAKTMNKFTDLSTVPMPSPEEIKSYIRKGKQLQSEAVHRMLKSAFTAVLKRFSGLSRSHAKNKADTATPISGHHAHGGQC